MARIQVGSDVPRAIKLFHEGRLDDAESICRRALKHNKRDVQALRVLGEIANAKGRLNEAIAHFQKGLRIKPDDPDLLVAMGTIHDREGRYDQALATFDKVLKRDPRMPDALTGKAGTLERMGDRDVALELLEPIVAEGREDTPMAFICSLLLQRAGRYQDSINLIGKHLERPNVPKATRVQFYYRLGQAHEKLKEYDQAFEAFSSANRLSRVPFNIDSQREFFDRIISTFSAERISSTRRSTVDSELPIFIASMPRSSSTLVEQILSSHPLAHGAGEITDFQEIMRDLPKFARSASRYPEVIEQLDQKTLDRLAHRYLGRLRQLDSGAERIVNKHLLNYIVIGLIAVLLPKARIIHCHRDPMDTCLSNFMHPFATNVNRYSTDLRDIGLYYCEYERLMRHWRDALVLPILDVKYEDLVSDQERISRRIIEFCGLPWDDACLRFFESKRSVSTLSYDQVRQPIYTSALQRWKRYEEHLGPLKEALAEGREAHDLS